MRKTILLILLFGLAFHSSVFAQETITIGSGNFAEPQILAEAVKILIEENTDLEVSHVRNFSGSSLIHSAFLAGDIDFYVSYTGTQFTGILGMEVTQEWKDPKKVEDYVQEQFYDRFDATWFDTFGFNNTYAVAVSRDFAEKRNITQISDLSEYASEMTIAMDNTFRERVGDGFDDFLQVYNLDFKRPVSMDYGLMYRAVGSGDVDAAIAYSTDGRIAALDLVIIEDDRHFFPPYDGALVARNAVLDAYPEIREVIQPLIGQISNEVIQRYNQLVDVDYKDAADAARQMIDEIIS